MRPRKTFLYYLCDAASQGTFYQDVNGIIKTTNIPTRLRQDPEGWLNNQLKIARSQHYYGLNRSFSTPLKFFGDGAAIVRNLFYTKRGVEQQVMIIILKWDPSDDTYYLYYKGLLDLSKIEDNVNEGVTVNVMEGGVVQLLKAYENTVFQIPCDGSIPENIKVNVDGVLFEDVLHYQFVPFTAGPTPGNNTLPMVFLSNEGDNIGIIHGNQNNENVTSFSYYSTSPNNILSSASPISCRLKGTITVKPDPSITNQKFAMTAIGSFSTSTVQGPSNAVSLVPSGQPYAHTTRDVPITQQTVYNFDVTINLAANETLFFTFFNDISAHPVSIIGGTVDISFNSQYPATRVWGITAYDLFRLLVKNICQTAGTTNQQFSYGADSQLLQQYLGIVFTGGDPLRASGDASYYKFYNVIQNNVNFPNINNYFSYGPVIKISLAIFFDSVNPILNASLSNQTLPGQNESLFVEKKQYVFDDSVVTMKLGEVAGLKVTAAIDYFFNILKIGFLPQQYEEKAGKFEYNTTAIWQAPVKNISKTFELICKARTDSYGIEKVRSNTGGQSITKNNSDSSVFILNSDFSSFIFDYFKASFSSAIPNTAATNNTNQKLLANAACQGIMLNIYDGNFLAPKSDPSIFMFNQPGLSSSMASGVAFNGTLNGFVGDSVTIKMWINGTLQQSWNFPVTGAGTPFNATYFFTRTYHFKDSIYFTVDTSPRLQATLSNFSLTVGSPYFSAVLSAPLTIDPGSGEQLVPLPTVTANTVGGFPVVSYGFQYFVFNNVLLNYNFGLVFNIAGFVQGSFSESVQYNVFRNGVIIDTVVIGGNTSQTPYSSQVGVNPITFALNDLVWITASVGNMTAYVTKGDLTITSLTIKAYALKRVKYDNLSGIPNSAPTTTGPGAPYNIEDLTPKRMLLKHGNFLRSILFNLPPDEMAFHSLDKNEFLSTTVGGVTITENENVDISKLDDVLFYPLIFEFKTQVPINFSDLLSSVANGHIEFTYNGVKYYGFPLEVTQVPALNDTQTWKLLCSPRTKPVDLVDLHIDGLNFLHIMPNQLYFAHLMPLKMVPLGRTIDPKYHFLHMDDDWFINQVNFWIHKKNYFQKWQMSDTIPIQSIANGLNMGNIDIYDCGGNKVNTSALVPVNPSPLQMPLYQLETAINFQTLGLPAGTYYIVARTPTGQPGISEGLDVRADWPMTLLFEYSHSTNRQSIIFSTGYNPLFRVEGWIDQYSPEGRFTTFEDQPADITVIDGIPFRKFKLNIAAPDGVPDWVIDKVMRIMLLDTVKIDGKLYTRDTDAKWEVKNTDSWPKRYWSLDIREAENLDGVTLGDGGALNVGVDIVYNLSTDAFGQNTGNGNVIQVIES